MENNTQDKQVQLRRSSGSAFGRWFVIVLLAAFVVAVDQWTKGLVEANVPLNSALAPFPALARYFNIVHFTNTGAAFGMLRDQRALFIAIPIIVIVAVLVYARTLPPGYWPIRVCLGFQLGGAAGNLIDRLQHGGRVTDFLLFMLPVGDRVYQWPAWNVADGSIVVGTIVLALLLLRMESAKPDPEAAH